MLLNASRSLVKQVDFVRCFSLITGEGIKLNDLSDNPGAHKKGKRVGRGVGSGKGKTSGRGHKGQKARAGGSAGRGPGFEGGQTPIYKRIPKRGFTNPLATPMERLNLGKLQYFIDMGRINPEEKITMKALADSGIIGKIKHGVKILGHDADHLTSKVDIEASRASSKAIEAIEKVGGSIKTIHLNRLALRAHLHPEKFEILPKIARPPPKLMKYYTDYTKRGYLSPEIQVLDQISEKST